MNVFRGKRYTFSGYNSFKIVLPPVWKGVYSERKEFAPKRSKFFPFRVDPFSDGYLQSRSNNIIFIFWHTGIHQWTCINTKMEIFTLEFRVWQLFCPLLLHEGRVQQNKLRLNAKSTHIVRFSSVGSLTTQTDRELNWCYSNETVWWFCIRKVFLFFVVCCFVVFFFFFFVFFCVCVFCCFFFFFFFLPFCTCT